MTAFLQKNITKITTLSVLAAVALAVILTVGASPQEAQAQSCRTVNVDAANFDHAVTASGRRDEVKRTSDQYTIDFSDYTNAGEYVSGLSYDASASLSYCAADTDCAASVSVDGAIYISGDGYPYDEGGSFDDIASDSGSFSYNFSHGSRSGYTLFINAAAEAYGGVHGISARGSIANTQIEICPVPNRGPNAVNDGGSSNRIPVAQNNPRKINVLQNDTDPDGDGLTIIGASTNKSFSSASVTSDQQVRYDARSFTGTPPGLDYITYTIEDAEGERDSARAYISVQGSGQNGQISVESKSSSGKSLSGNSFTPKYDGGNLPTRGGSAIYNVPLYEAPKLAVMRQSAASPPAGYRWSNDANPGEAFPVQDTPSFQQTTADPETEELGLNYTESDPTASFSSSPSGNDHYVGDDLTFDASGSGDSDGSIRSYSWNFGDGTTRSGQTVSHSYSSRGQYTVTLTVEDNDGLTGDISKNVSIGEWVQVASRGGAVYCNPNQDKSDNSSTGQIYNADGNHRMKITWSNSASHEAQCSNAQAPSQDKGFFAKVRDGISSNLAYARVPSDGGGGDDGGGGGGGGGECQLDGTSESDLAFSAFGQNVNSSVNAVPGTDYDTESDTINFSGQPSGTVDLSQARSACDNRSFEGLDWAASHSIKVYEYRTR